MPRDAAVRRPPQRWIATACSLAMTAVADDASCSVREAPTARTGSGVGAGVQRQPQLLVAADVLDGAVALDEDLRHGAHGWPTCNCRSSMLMSVPTWRYSNASDRIWHSSLALSQLLQGSLP